MVMPMLRNVHELPFLTWLPYDIQKSLPFFYFMYAFHFGNAVYAGGSNLAVNMFVYSTLVMMEFCLNLLGARLTRLGYGDGQPQNTNLQRKVSCYKDIIKCVQLHLQIDRYRTISHIASRSNILALTIDGYHFSVARDVHNLFNNLLYVQVLQSAFLFANSAFLLIAVSNSDFD